MINNKKASNRCARAQTHTQTNQNWKQHPHPSLPIFVSRSAPPKEMTRRLPCYSLCLCPSKLWTQYSKVTATPPRSGVQPAQEAGFGLGTPPSSPLSFLAVSAADQFWRARWRPERACAVSVWAAWLTSREKQPGWTALTSRRLGLG